MAENDSKSSSRPASGTKKPAAKRPAARRRASPAKAPRAAQAKAPAADQSAAEAKASAASQTAAAPEAPTRSAGSGRAIVLIFGIGLLSLLVIAVMAWPGTGDRIANIFTLPKSEPAPAPFSQPAPKADPRSDVPARLKAVEVALAQLSQDIAALKSAPAPAPALPKELEARLAALETKPGAEAVDADRLAAVEKRLDALAERLRARDAAPKPAPAPVSGRQSGALAALALAQALRDGTPFAGLAQRLPAGSDETLAASLAALAPYAANGVPSRVDLKTQFAALPRTQAKAEAPQPAAPAPKPASKGFWDRVTGKLTGLVKVRRAADAPAPKPSPAADAFATAGRALARDDLAAAAAALARSADPKVATWRKHAAARLRADEAARALQSLAVSSLTGGPEAP